MFGCFNESVPLSSDGPERSNTKIRQENNRPGPTSFTIMFKKNQNSWRLETPLGSLQSYSRSLLLVEPHPRSQPFGGSPVATATKAPNLLLNQSHSEPCYATDPCWTTCKVTIPVEAEVIQLAANCSRCEVVIPQLIIAVSRLLIPSHDTSARVTVFTLHVQHKSVQPTSDEIVGRYSRVAWTWRPNSRRCWACMQWHKTM